MKVMIVVTHLLGTGHLSRALTLGHAFRDAGDQVLLVSGGMPAPQLRSDGLEMLSLPPVRSDGVDFARLLDADGTPADAAYLNARTEVLCAALRDFQPDALITELFPFGRRSLASEFETLLHAARDLTPRPVILSSIRDILAPPSKPAKAARTEEVIERYYDGVLVHSDPQGTRLDVSWPVTPALERRLYYTGYVAPAPAEAHPDGEGAEEILVSAGGGSVGQPIFRAAIEAARKITNRRWRLLVGGRDAEDRIAGLAPLARDLPVLIEPARPDFRQMLGGAAASVSMCGYNTALDMLQSGCPAVFIPFDDGKEVEQSLRAQSLAQLRGIEVLTSSELTGDTLAEAVARVIQAGPRPDLALSFDGAARSVEIVHEIKALR